MELQGWQSPRISLSYSLNGDSRSDVSSPSKNHRPCASPEFEFWMVRNPACPSPHLLSADQLFVDGILQPLHLLPSQNQDVEAEEVAAAQEVEEGDDGDGNEPEPRPETEREAAPSPAAVAEPAALPELEKPIPSSASTCISSTSGSKRWKDIFRVGEKKEKEKEKEKKKDRKKSSAELNINIWPFSRSRSAGTSSGGRTRATASAGRKANSAPCSRSNSTGESKSKLQMEVEYRPLGLQLSLEENGRCGGAGAGRGRRWASSSGRPAGVYLGRSSPVRPVRRVGSVTKKIDRCTLGSEKKQRGGVGPMTMRVLNVNVPLCMGYGQHSGCSSAEQGSAGGGGGLGRGGSSRSNCGSSRSNCGSSNTATSSSSSHSNNPPLQPQGHFLQESVLASPTSSPHIKMYLPSNMITVFLLDQLLSLLILWMKFLGVKVTGFQ